MEENRPPEKEPVYQFKVTLRGSAPPIWRRIHVSSGISLYKLHLVLQIVMGWENYHLYEFRIRKVAYGEPNPELDYDIENARRHKLHQLGLRARSKFVYVYDMGDDWEHDLLLEKSIPAGQINKPLCLAGERSCPPEDCGGIWGYQNLLEIISDPAHEEYQEMMEWLGGEFVPERFDLEEVNRQLRKLR